MVNELIVQINRWGDLLFQHFWIPMLIWTSFTGLLLFASYFQNKQNPFFEYYLKISLFFSLPIGLCISPIVNQFSSWLSTTGSSGPVLYIPTNLDFSTISENFISSPVFISASGFIALVSAAFGIVIIIKIIQLFIEVVRLNKLNQLLDLTSLELLDNLSQKNIQQVNEIEKEVFVAISNLYKTPFTFGWNKPVIVIPEPLLSDESSLNMMISHELVHIRRGDFLQNFIVNLFASFFWYNPVIQVLNNQINDFREITCDQEVITEFQASPSKYAKLIFSFSTIDDRNPYLQIALARFNSNLTKRIKKMSTLPSKTTLNVNTKISIGLIATCITMLVACTETSSQIELSADDLNSKDQPSLKLTYTDSAKYTFLLDGEKIEYGALSEAINVNAIGSISVDNENGKKIVRISSNDYQAPKAVYKIPDNSDVFTVVEKMPELKGGIQSIASEIDYPEQARKEGIEGRVIVTFVVDKDGNVQNPQIVRGIGAGCDEEALRVVKDAQFTPGEQRGRKVDVQYTLPIVFKLS